MKVRFAGLTDPGLLRDKNEDNWSAYDKDGIFVVSDGMGGRPAGETASRLVTEVFPRILLQHIKQTENFSGIKIEACLTSAIQFFNSSFLEQSRAYPALSGMGATLVVLWLVHGLAWIGHLGDSRLYMLRQNKIKAMTRDHTILQYLIDMKQVDPGKAAAAHPLRGNLARHIGMPGPVQPDVCHLQVEKGDRFLLCTDGLTDMVMEKDIARTLDDNRDNPDVTCRILVDLAKASGGKDNITVLLIDFMDQDEVIL